MEFIYADTLKAKFDVFGHFYRLQLADQVFNCRSVLEIVDASEDVVSTAEPYAVVVMMNPGSSKPADPEYVPKQYSAQEITSESWEKEVVRTCPDNAQYQIMRLMLLRDWKRVKVLNLSDLRNGNSGGFSETFIEASSYDPSSPHSVTHPGRLGELLSHCSNSRLTIAAWGSTEVLREAARTFISKVPQVRGLELEHPWYRYPSPYRKDQKLDWLKCANEELET